MMKSILLISIVYYVFVSAETNWAGTANSNVDRPGNDFDNQPIVMWTSSTWEDCQWKCYIEPTCVAWSYDSCNRDKCWIKTDAPAQVGADCRWSGVMNGRSPKPKPDPQPTPTRNPDPTPDPKPDPKPDQCSYTKGQIMNGTNFLNYFDFWTGKDPTHGYVQYKTITQAKSLGMAKVNTDGSVYVGVNHIDKQYDGRDSFRMVSRKAFTEGLLIFDMDHVPNSACGSWPAIWTTGPNWPNGGEIDIYEGVNLNTQNQITLHTNRDCSVPDNVNQHGDPVGTNCDVGVSTTGCGVLSKTQGAFANEFNDLGGGAYVMERGKNAINVWYFSRGNYPDSLLTGSPNPCEFGIPEASFPFDNCNANHFGPQNLVINIAFCGDWADAKGLFNKQCPGTCTDYVTNNPGMYNGTYFQFKSFRFFQK